MMEIILAMTLNNSALIINDVNVSKYMQQNIPGIYEANPIVQYFAERDKWETVCVMALGMNAIASYTLYQINPDLCFWYNLAIGVIEVLSPYLFVFESDRLAYKSDVKAIIFYKTF